VMSRDSNVIITSSLPVLSLSSLVRDVLRIRLGAVSLDVSHERQQLQHQVLNAIPT
jgi:hypothetical protein